MTTDLVTYQTDLPEKMEWARTLATASLLPKAYQKQPGNVLFAVEYADALGISRINAITSIHVIDGKPSASADLIAALVRRAGHKLRVNGDDQQATAQIIRKDDPEFTYVATWDMDKAKAAGLAGKGVWKNYPAAMLRSRAITEVARMGASEALLGLIYTPEELGADVDQTGAPVRSTMTVTVEPTSGADRMRDMLGQTEGAGDEPPTANGVDDPAPSPPVDIGSAPELITPDQLKALQASFKDAGIGTQQGRHQFAEEVIEHPVNDSSELTRAEASKVIDALKSLPTDGTLPIGDTP